jgi:hypothetical protein
MLLSGYLHKEKPILTEWKYPPATFFLFREGKIWWEIGIFCPETEPNRSKQPPFGDPFSPINC